MLEEPAKIDDRDCYRVQVKRPDGKAVFWIDRESFALLRVVYPTDELAAAIRRGGRSTRSRWWPSSPGTFRRQDRPQPPSSSKCPEDAKMVKFFIPPHPGQLLGKKVPPFQFFDLTASR